MIIGFIVESILYIVVLNNKTTYLLNSKIKSVLLDVFSQMAEMPQNIKGVFISN